MRFNLRSVPRRGFVLLASLALLAGFPLLIGLPVLADLPVLEGLRASSLAHAAGVPSADLARLQTPAPTGRIVVKFTETCGLHVWEGHLQPAADAATASMETFLRQAAPGFAVERRFTAGPDLLRQQRATAELRSGERLPDLNGYVQLVPAAQPSRDDLIAVLERLTANPAIETAFLEPVAVPAALGFDAFTGAFTDPAIPATEASGRAQRHIPATGRAGDAQRGILATGATGHTQSDRIGSDIQVPTPDFSGQQGYLDPAPLGVNAEGVWANPGGRGQTVKVIDIEGAWLWTHEDLTAPFFTAGGVMPDASWRNHGTAVLGEIRGTANGIGVTGIAYETQIGAVSIAELSVADAIHTAATNLAIGDVFLIELHAPGPNANGSGQYGYVCMEYWQDNFDVIRLATAMGRICCQAAGNGEQNLDDPVYGGLFDRNVRDSGSIICGATDGGNLNPAWFTNYGARVDLHGWGFQVVTCAYGDLQGGAETQWYTQGFSGTSSASPIVTGSVASLQGMAKAAFGVPLTARLARDILVATGTPQSGSRHIGPRPNLTAAWTMLSTGVGAVAGSVTDGTSGDPIPSVAIDVVGEEAFAATGDDGSFYLALTPGDYEFVFDSFFHITSTVPATVVSGSTTPLNVVLDRRPLVAASGTVRSADGGIVLSGVRVTPQGVPVDGVVTGIGGGWTISGMPAGREYDFLFDGRPGFGADFATFLVEGSGGHDVQLSPATETFEGSNGGFTSSSQWAYGTPAGADGPSAGFSGLRCWGVGMTGPYGDNRYGTLTSPAYDFSGEQELRLSFHYWSETEADYDGVSLFVWNPQTSAWEPREPLEGYPSVSLGGIDYRAGWSGSTDGWVGTVFDLTDVISNGVRFRLEFGSDGGVTGPGFWVDEIAFDTGDETTDVSPGDLAAGPSAEFGFGRCAPNPASGAVRVELRMPTSDEASLAVYDAAGRRVARLHEGPLAAGTAAFVWDRRDEAGREVPSGVYFLRAVSGSQRDGRTLTVLR